MIPVQYQDPGDPGGAGFGPDGYGPPGSGRQSPGQARGSRARGPYVLYRGFKIDIGEARGVIDVSSAVRSVEHQIDIVDRAGVSPAIRRKFVSVPVRISVTFSGSGSHYTGGPEVILGSVPLSDDRPILLHEYMHVLEFRRGPGVGLTADIRRFYDEAKAGGLYPPQAYLMTNPGEFFAVTASCYLNGTVAREPFTREGIRSAQPDYYTYLSRLFGRGGSAARRTGTTVASSMQ